jgi:hypothetical protein
MEGLLTKKRGDGVGDGSLQSHPGVNLHPKRAKNRGNVPKGGEADGDALTLLVLGENKTIDCLSKLLSCMPLGMGSSRK